LITVTDNGIGIQLKDIDRIFEPKFTNKSSGMGLGLGIIKTSSKIIKEQLPLKLNLEKELLYCFAPTLTPNTIMNYENILITTENNATITINRPTKLNALNVATISDLNKAFKILAAK
jgi:K+-sensing histidine kinase KdpD